MKCPIDGTDLMMSDRSGVEIDYCPKCRGIWLDKGELDKIIERSADHYHEEGPDYEDKVKYSKRDKYHSDRHHYKRKKGFLGDLFDFD